jgi:hypothetical protein
MLCRDSTLLMHRGGRQLSTDLLIIVAILPEDIHQEQQFRLKVVLITPVPVWKEQHACWMGGGGS